MRKIIIGIVAGVTTVAAWCFLGFSLRGGPGPGVDATPYETSGRLVAQQALALLEPGGQITVITRDTDTFKNPASDIQLASFRNAITKAHAAIGTLHKLQVDPLRPIAVPSSDFCQAIRNTPSGNVIVSFMGPPVLTAAERSHMGDNQPAIVAFCSGNLPDLGILRSLFQQGLLHAAVVDRRGSDAVGQASRPEESFLTLTATNFAEVAAAEGAKH